MTNSLSVAVLCRVVASLITVAIGFINLRLYNVYLTKESYGAMVVATNVLGYLPLVSGGFDMVLGQQMLASRHREETVKIARFVQVFQSHLLLVALLVGVGLMAIYSQSPLARSTGLPWALFISFGLSGVAGFYSGGQIGLLIGLGEQLCSIILFAGMGLLSFVLMWTGFLLGFGIWAVPISTAFGALSMLPVTWTLHQRFAKGLPIISWHRDADFWSRLKGVWVSSAIYLGCQFSIMLLFSIDIILMGFLFGPGAATIYATISRMGQLSRQVIQTLGETAWPRLARESDFQRKVDLMRKIDRLNAWLGGAWHGGMLATLQPFLGWYLSADKSWIAGSSLIALMLARNLIEVLSAPHSYGLLSEARYKDIARSSNWETLALVAGIFLFSHYFGMNGLAFGVLMGTGGGALWYLTYVYYRRVHHTSWFDEWRAVYARALAGVVIGFVVASLAWRGEENLLGAPGWAAVAAGGLGLGAGLVVAYLFGLIRSRGQTHWAGGWIKLPSQW